MPSLEESEIFCESRSPDLLAIHLVSQVLDEACIIANAASESGRPWKYLSRKKNVMQDLTYIISPRKEMAVTPGGHCEPDEVVLGDCCSDNGKMESNNVVTSTPQKIVDDNNKFKAEANIIGQGDEDAEAMKNDLNDSTSMFINHLFDMSDVEKFVIEEEEIHSINIGNTILRNDLLTRAISDIVVLEGHDNVTSNVYNETVKDELADVIEHTSRSTDHSSFSLLSDVLPGDLEEDVVFYVDDNVPSCSDNNCDILQEPTTSQKALQVEQFQQLQLQYDEVQKVKKENSDLYENAYLTMNRDYDQYSNEDDYPVLQDPKGLIMQEVDLMNAHTSGNMHPISDEPVLQQFQELAATSAVSATVSGSRKSGIVRRCRLQGTRILACLRGWWRRKTPGRRKEARVPGSMRGLCPLSPNARCRAASLLDQRHLPSPLQSRSVAWKFNTVNESLVNCNRWKEYTFEAKPDECGEY